MKIYTRHPNFGFKGRHIAYDNVEEARAHEITEFVYSADLDRNTPPRVESWLVYEDGVVAQVLGIVWIHKKEYVIKTILNIVYARFGARYGKYIEPYGVIPFNLDLETVDTKKIEFVHDWLFNGVPLHEAVSKHFSTWRPLLLTGNGHLVKRGSTSAPRYYESSRTKIEKFGYLILSGHWFDKLLDMSRVYRDKYMNLVNSFERAGITAEYLGAVVKAKIDSPNPKESVPMIKLAVEVIKTEEARRNLKKDNLEDLNPNLLEDVDYTDVVEGKLLAVNPAAMMGITDGRVTEAIPVGLPASYKDFKPVNPEAMDLQEILQSIVGDVNNGKEECAERDSECQSVETPGVQEGQSAQT